MFKVICSFIDSADMKDFPDYKSALKYCESYLDEAENIVNVEISQNNKQGD